MKGRLALFLSVAAVVAAFALVWLPEVTAYWASPLLVDRESVRRAKSEPATEVLERVRSENIGLHLSSSESREAVIEAGERALQGEAEFFKQPRVRLQVPFTAANLDVGSPTTQLYVASLATADLMLRAYRRSGDERFLKAAGAEIVAFANIERWRLVPHGFLWNDHAMAARIAVVADYWSIVRTRRDVDDNAARDLLSLVSRSAQRLANSRLYTYRTNHGVMQDIALLQVATAFPYLDHDDAYRKTGCRRLAELLPYYVSPEGPVLEHSAGYHEVGLELLTIVDKVTKLAKCPKIPDFDETLQRVKQFRTTLRRPDGSLPTYGDTVYTYGPDADDSPAWERQAPPSSVNLYPVAGHAIWWHRLDSWPDGAGLGQTVITWSNFPSRAHKLADDMSVIIWHGGRTWISNVGYWPYGAQGEREARGWRGSNAPHYEGESPNVVRETILRGHAANDRVQIADLERHGLRGGPALQRLIAAIDDHLWLVADFASGTHDGRVQRVWTSPPDVRTRRLAPAEFLLEYPPTGAGARMSMLGDVESAPEELRGSLTPFGGWVVAGTPTPAPAFVVSQRASDSVVLTVLATGEQQALEQAPSPTLVREGPAGWRVDFPAAYGVKHASWNGRAFEAQFSDGSTSALTPQPPAKASDEARTRIVDAYRSVATRYPATPDLTRYRLRITLVLLAVLLLQEAALFTLRRRPLPTVLATRLRLATVGAWVCGALLVQFWYLQH